MFFTLPEIVVTEICLYNSDTSMTLAKFKILVYLKETHMKRISWDFSISRFEKDFWS